jgi:DNA polymerase III alpha subunit
MPDAYKSIHVFQWLEEKLQEKMQTGSTATVLLSKEWARVTEEFEEFKRRDMLPLLQYMIYLVDYMRENNIVWGVGRGSSVASYVLYLIGVHRINSIQYDLDWTEFLR